MRVAFTICALIIAPSRYVREFLISENVYYTAVYQTYFYQAGVKDYIEYRDLYKLIPGAGGPIGVRRILTAETYTGRFRWGRFGSCDKDGKRIIKPMDEVFVFDVPPIGVVRCEKRRRCGANTTSTYQGQSATCCTA